MTIIIILVILLYVGFGIIYTKYFVKPPLNKIDKPEGLTFQGELETKLIRHAELRSNICDIPLGHYTEEPELIDIITLYGGKPEFTQVGTMIKLNYEFTSGRPGLEIVAPTRLECIHLLSKELGTQ